MIWTAWNNGRWHTTGAGYGFTITASDRDQLFSRRWTSVVVDLPTDREPLRATVNVQKASFWSGQCREVISVVIGRWLISKGYARWPVGAPPKFEVRRTGTARFEVVREAA
jgi:hypothetical protein